MVWIFLLMMLAWPIGAQAHIPKVGEERPTYSVCNKEAADDIFTVAKEWGVGATAIVAFGHERARACRSYGGLVRAVAVSEPAYTPDNYMVYMIQVEPVKGTLPSGSWFAFHKHEAEDAI
ncbi:hypothetical protein LCGC14_2327600 [marine sediment metagenome]|uniref:Uncharacterized protein n=1 Tax=marine sediment metagenome TaxID=412755 RepID=A0A0F9ETG7_9ZZZZ